MGDIDYTRLAQEILASHGGVPIMRDFRAEWVNDHKDRISLQRYDNLTVDLSVGPTAPPNILPATGEKNFDGNVIAIHYLQGAPALGVPFLYLRYDEPGAKPIPIYGEMSIKRDYSKVYISWPILAAGRAEILLGVDLQV